MRTPSKKWSNIGDRRRKQPERWTIGLGLGFGAVVTIGGDGWLWWISDGAGDVVAISPGTTPLRDTAMLAAEDAAAPLVRGREGATP